MHSSTSLGGRPRLNWSNSFRSRAKQKTGRPIRWSGVPRTWCCMSALRRSSGSSGNSGSSDAVPPPSGRGRSCGASSLHGHSSWLGSRLSWEIPPVIESGVWTYPTARPSSRRVIRPGQSPQRDRRRLVTGRFCRFRAGVPVMTAAGRKVLPRKMMCQLSGRPRIRKQGIASATAVVRMTTNSSARTGLARPRAGRESALQNCACAEGVVGWSSSSPAKWGVESRESRDSNR